MDLNQLERISDSEWRIAPRDAMRVPGVIYASESLVREMDEKVFEQVKNVATLPGIVEASYAMPDAHWGYGFPIGGVAAFDPRQGGVVSAGGVGFDISCGVRLLTTGLHSTDLSDGRKERLADTLFHTVPAGVGSTGTLRLDDAEMNNMLLNGAQWAVARGYGTPHDLERIEEHGQMQDAEPAAVSDFAKRRQRDEMGTLGSGNHYLEVQRVAEVFNIAAANALDIHSDDLVVSIHCGSRGLGHQIGTEFLKEMVLTAQANGIALPDRELACAPITSEVGQRYLGAMRAGINCALANRQVITDLTRRAFSAIFSNAKLDVVYDVSHNTCKLETHKVQGTSKQLYVHRKGATRAFGPGDKSLPNTLRDVGQPVLIGGTMGTESYVLVGANSGVEHAFASACHGAGRAMSRHEATKRWRGQSIVKQLATRGIIVHSPSMRGIAEEAPSAYKNVADVVNAACAAGLTKKVARLEPLICIKG